MILCTCDHSKELKEKIEKTLNLIKVASFFTDTMTKEQYKQTLEIIKKELQK